MNIKRWLEVCDYVEADICDILDALPPKLRKEAFELWMDKKRRRALIEKHVLGRSSFDRTVPICDAIDTELCLRERLREELQKLDHIGELRSFWMIGLKPFTLQVFAKKIRLAQNNPEQLLRADAFDQKYLAPKDHSLFTRDAVRSLRAWVNSW